MTYGHSSGLPQEAPVMIAEKRKLFFSFLFSPSFFNHVAYSCKTNRTLTQHALPEEMSIVFCVHSVAGCNTLLSLSLTYVSSTFPLRHLSHQVSS